MRLELHLSMDSDAFSDDEAGAEVARILTLLASDCRYGWELDSPMRLRDSNGNRVGYAVVTENELPAIV